MMMDDDMEDMKDMDDEFEYPVHEIDFDYEFDACKFVDLCRDETFAEAQEAEMWFESAPDYPPSPFVAKLMLGDMILLENLNVSPKGTVKDNTELHNYQTRVRQMSVLDATSKGLTFYNHMAKDGVKEKPKARIKSTLPRNSTLMKPTASQLAKQNKPHPSFGTRFNTTLLQTSDKTLNNSFGTESQAPKRQKLDGGQLHKIVDMKQPSPLVHKASNSKKDGIVDFSSNAKRFTVPKEPEFVTRQRVQTSSLRNKTRPEQVTPTAYSFRARPLNRKILDTPSMPLPKKSTPRTPEFQEFQLKTAERSVQHGSSVPSSSLHCGNFQKTAARSHSSFTSKKVDNDKKSRPLRMGTSQHDGNETTQMFKALPVNKRIFSSKGEIGVSRSTKKNVTVPMEFKFETEKRMQNHPPVDLFSKLSLASDLHPIDGKEKSSRLIFTTEKGLKENGVSSQQVSEMTTTDRERTIRFWPDQFHCSSYKIAAESGLQAGRWLGIR